jgi:hypothetical protein
MTADAACEARARELADELRKLGVSCHVHWDRSPWGVRVPLVDDDSEWVPALYVLTEGTEELAGMADTWVWFGVVGNFGDAADNQLCDTGFRWHERHWCNEGVAPVAERVATITSILRHGAKHAHTTWAAADDDELPIPLYIAE